MPQTPLYTSHYEIQRCLIMNHLIILGELILSGIVSVPFPELFPDGSLKGVLYFIIASSIVLWSCCLRVIYFYENHLVLYYPLRPFARERTFTYDEISSVVFFNDYGRFSEKHLLLHLRSGIKRSCSIEFCDTKKAHKVPYLLRFLKQKGIRIEGHNVMDNDIADCTEARIEMIFGSGKKHIRRIRERESKEDDKIFLIFFIFVLFAFIMMGVFISFLVE